MIPITKPCFGEEEINNIKSVLDTGWVAQGPMVEAFEKKLKEHEKIKHAIATTSCTTALHLALLAHEIGKDDDVIIPSFTFIATANSVVYTGATPVFVDIDLDTFNISCESITKTIEEKYSWNGTTLNNKKTNNKLKAIMVVHQFGLCAEMPLISKIAQKYNLIIIEDAACALGAKIKDTHQGNFGNTSCVSFHPRKCITTGEGGMVFTNKDKIASKIRELRSHGATVSETSRNFKHSGVLLPDFKELGYNYRMSDIQAAVGAAQADKLDEIISKRREHAKRYDELFEHCTYIKTPKTSTGYFHTYQSYVCLLDSKNLSLDKMSCLRNKLMEVLSQNGIQTRQGTHALHTTAFYQREYQYRDEDFENSLLADRLTIAIPLYFDITEEEQKYIVDCIDKSYSELINSLLS